MLKDGTSEVWPESVEKIFVDGLRQYWESPWATYSRGRSRWRNQFLVDYLKDAGIERSKKQVASHIQVLRNMWKGEKEYQLVAGGEELFQENGLLSHNSSLSRAAQSDVLVKEEQKEAQSPFAPRTPSDSSDFPSESETLTLEPLHPLDMSTDRTPGAFLAPLPLGHPRSIKDEGLDLTLPFPSNLSSSSSFMASSLSPPLLVRNSVTAISLSAAGMQPLIVNVSQSASPSSLLPNYPSHVSIHIKLSLSSLHDVSSPPTLHGFSGTVTFAAPWASVAQCTTRSYAGGVCESIEQAYFESAAPLSPVTLTPVTVPLPESGGLSSCRWGSIGVETRIIQQITVDNEELACVTYDLTRTASGPPTAEVLRVSQGQGQHLAAAAAPATASATLPEPASFLSLSLSGWNSGPSYAPYVPYVPRSQEPHSMYSRYTSIGSPSSFSDSGEQQYTQSQYTPSVLFS